MASVINAKQTGALTIQKPFQVTSRPEEEFTISVERYNTLTDELNTVTAFFSREELEIFRTQINTALELDS